MRIIEINEAEAIIEPFWDGGTGDYMDLNPRYKVFDEYTINTLNGAIAKVEQGWAYVTFTVDKTVKNIPILSMERDCNLDISDYDTFIFFANLPKSVIFSVKAIVNNKEIQLYKDVKGVGASQEFNAPICGDNLTHLKIEFSSESDGINGTICWFGLSESHRLERMLNKKNYYDSKWTGYFIEEKNANITPDINILFDNEELNALRDKVKISPFKEVYQVKKTQAQKDMSIVPEKYIGRYLPHFDQRWNRSRDKEWAPDLTKNACGMHGVIENLAFVGIIESDYDMLRMASRHAISIAHCECWFDSPMGNLPGATWHHRSFVENLYCKSVSLVLDWCGSILTPFAKQVLCDALAMKGLPRIESDFKRVEYIRYMNQGIVFSYGRIFALLALMEYHPRYITNLKEAEEDLISMIGNYVQEDGGTLEGPGYWMFTFTEVISAFYALARQKKVDFTYYKDIFMKTGDFVLSLMSMEDDGTIIMPINDCHPGVNMSCTLANSFYQFTNSSNWKNLYEKLMAKKYIDDDSFAIISSPLPEGIKDLPDSSLNRIYPITGQVGSVRQGKDIKTHVHLCSGPTYTAHYNADKGGLILEAEGYTICPDCGSPNYSESELFYITAAQAHSLLNPVNESGVLSRQYRDMEGGKILKAEVNGTGVEFMSDDTLAWNDNVYKSITRRIISPFAEFCVIVDDFELGTADYAEFLLNSYGEYILCNNEATSRIRDITLRVRPLNWNWQNPSIKEMQDGEHRKVWQLRAPTTEGKNQCLVTAICLEKNAHFEFEEIENGFIVFHGSDKMVIKISNNDIDIEYK